MEHQELVDQDVAKLEAEYLACFDTPSSDGVEEEIMSIHLDNSDWNTDICGYNPPHLAIELLADRPWANWGAWQPDGSFMVFENRPEKTEDGWVDDGGYWGTVLELNVTIATWQHSLVDFKK